MEAPSSSKPAGAIEFTGTWRGDGQRYRIELQPVVGGAAMGRGVQAHAVPLGIGGRTSKLHTPLVWSMRWKLC